MIYLDHNATTPVRPEVLDALLPWLRDGYGNPSSVYALGQKARAAVERARERVAGLIGAADASEIVFTSGGSESDVLALAGAAWQALDESKGRRRRIVSTRIEHDAVRALLTQLRRRGFEIAEAACGADGITPASALAALISDETAVVSVMHANNETGALQPVMAAAAAGRAKGALVHTDAVQSLGKTAVDVKSLGVDLLALSGHKLNAPKGVGALYVRRGVRLSAVVTGHQEKNRRGGTENVAGIVGLGLACELAARELSSAAAHALALRKRIESGVLAVAGSRLNGHPELRLPNTSHFSFADLDGHHLVVGLDLEGVCVSSGPACSSGASEPSHVLTAMGVPSAAAAGSIRVSVGWGTTDADVDRFLAILPKTVARLRAAAVPA
jgi:cysteine desulfurase